jgi:rRNA-processing protein FCF1
MKQTVLDAVYNAPESYKNYYKDTVSALSHPLDTLETVGKGVVGGMVNLLPDYLTTGNPLLNNESMQESIRIADTIGQDYKDRYGSWDKVQESFAVDPARTLSDLSLLSGVAGKLAKMSGANKVGTLATNVAKVTEPLTPITATAKLAGKGATVIANQFDRVKADAATEKAAKLVQSSLGDKLPVVQAQKGRLGVADGYSSTTTPKTTSQVLAELQDNATPNQSLNAPTTQSLLKTAEQYAPEKVGDIANKQRAIREAQIKSMMKGDTVTESKTRRKQAREAVGEELAVTYLNPALEAANKTNRVANAFNQRANQIASNIAPTQERLNDFERAAGADVSKVRRNAMLSEFTLNKATDPAYLNEPPKNRRYENLNDPYETSKRTSEGYLDAAILADEQASLAAESSLTNRRNVKRTQAELDDFTARLNESKLREQRVLADKGLKPMTVDKLTSQLKRVMADDNKAGLKVPENVINDLMSQLAERADKNGYVSANALHALRKNGINDAVGRLNPTLDQTARKRAEAAVLSEVKPILTRAIEGAGGTGYSKFLDEFSKAAQKLEQRKMAAELYNLHGKSPDEFVSVIKGNSPDRVEKVFGSGNFDFKEQMGDMYPRFKKMADEVSRDKKAESLASGGETRFKSLLEDMSGKLKTPTFLNTKLTTTKTIINELEGLLDKKTRDILMKASYDVKSFDELANYVPKEKWSTIRQFVMSKMLPGTENNAMVKAVTTTPLVKNAFTRTAGAIGTRTEPASKQEEARKSK